MDSEFQKSKSHRRGTAARGSHHQRQAHAAPKCARTICCAWAKPYVPRTTDSRHGFTVVPNLTRGLIPTGLDQIWVADITYIRLGEGFVYLSVVLDAFSRKVVGWALEDHLEASLA